MMFKPLSLVFVVLCFSFGSTAVGQTNANRQGTDESRLSLLDQQLSKAGDNRSELEKALKEVGAEQKPGMEFLIKHMPVFDLQNLTSDFLLQNVQLAYQARKEAAWEIPDSQFFNDVLPYANIDEPRDPWRKEMRDLCLPLVKDCKSPGEAAQRLNETVFQKLSVKYSTKRKRANQSPKESIEQGLASCTGLSIILVDACRSVGVPARLAGIPSWKNKRGNHTWVEVWDEQWHFTGAAEPNANGLNHTWFQGDAALADPNSRRHSIYAVSFQKTDTTFPMVWSPDKRVFAQNVTRRYLKTSKEDGSSNAKANVMFRVWNSKKTERVVVQVAVECQSCEETLTGKTKAGTADMNDMLSFALDRGREYKVTLQQRDESDKVQLKVIYELKTDERENQLVELILPDPNQTSKNQPASNSEDAGEAVEAQDDSGLSPTARRMLKQVADEHFQDSAWLDEQLLNHPDAVKELAWNRYLDSTMALKQKQDYDNNKVTFKQHVSPYTIKSVGKRPKNGWPLFIAMHGGGGAPQRVNDSQWRHMQIYYKDQAQLEGYKYLALRAPNNTWNGFYDVYVYPLIENLVRQFIVYGDVDPNKVFIMGYSHGGYGAFAIGPKIPYRFAAVHSSAAAPTDGETTAKTLRSTRFTFMVGEKDTAYGRRKRCEKFANQVKELKDKNAGDYPVEFMFKKGYGHGGLPDRDMISEMYDYQRDPVPSRVTWEMTDSVVNRFFWLKCDQPSKGQMIDAEIKGNQVIVTCEKATSFSILLDRRLIGSEKQIELIVNGSESKITYRPSFETLCKTIAESGDPNLAFDFEIKVNLEN